MSLCLYALFHLNLAYSSIEEERRPEVIRRCYRPLLDLLEAGVPLALEMSGYTLEAIHVIDPEWVQRLRSLLAAGAGELVASGRAQLIGPLVPAVVNRANLRLGLEDYERLLGVRPRIALVNEQAWSAGLAVLYREAGFEGVIMEWDNPASAHPHWSREWRYRPQLAAGRADEAIPVIWSHSIAFQKFQRHAHEELELDEYLAYLRSHAGGTPRLLSLYANDAEVFDFRPGRFAAEPALGRGEWTRIGRLFAALATEPGIELMTPSAGLARFAPAHRLSLSNAAQPIPVKKQYKYNVLRWAVTGRDDLAANTLCLRIARALERAGAPDEAWRELCDLWASDYRTHITTARWERYVERLGEVCRRHGVPPGMLEETRTAAPAAVEGCDGSGAAAVQIERHGRFLDIVGARLRLRLNCRRGLAIDALGFDDGPAPVVTLPHGYFDAIGLGADWYSGHLVYEAAGESKVTDLQPVEPRWAWEGGCLRVEAEADTPAGTVSKCYRLDPAAGTVELSIRAALTRRCFGSLRLGFLTLNPEAFARDSLWAATHNGGDGPERFQVAEPFDHGRAVSHLVSAGGCLGLTGDWLELGDAQRRLRVELERERSALVGLMSFQPDGERYLWRLGFSAAELDETRTREGGATRFEAVIRLSCPSVPVR